MIRTRFGVAALALVAAVSGCGEDKKKAQVYRGYTIAIGSVAPLTGGIAHLGKDNENGARLAIEEANAAKIKIGSKDAAFELISYDDQADPKVGTTVAQKLVDAKVAGVVGHLNSGTSIPASPIYNQAGIPVISGSATNPKLTEQGFKTQFRLVGRDDQQGPAIASYLAATTKPKVAAVIDDATAYGEGIANEVEKTLKAAGVNVLPREKGTDKTTDWKAILTKVKGRSPDAVFYGGMDATGGPLLKQGRELGIKAVFSFGDGACTDKMKELAGDSAEGLLCSQAGIPAQAASKKFLDAYKKRFNIDPILYSPFTYDATNMLIEAMKKADSADPAKYLPVLQKLEFTGATGKISFDAKGDRADAEMTIFTMKGGKIEPIAIIKGGKTVSYQDFIAQAAAPQAGGAAKK
jgi:branched-chain amino acid transport system substrate-binding protein